MVCLRKEVDGEDARYLYASLNDAGQLVVHGIDEGPQAFAGDEYEWTQTVEPEHIPALLEALGAVPDGPILEQLETFASGKDSYRLSRLLSTKTIPCTFHLGEVSPHLRGS